MEDMRTYSRNFDRGDLAAADQAALLSAHARTIGEQVAQLKLRQAYLEAKAGFFVAFANGERKSAEAQRSIELARELSRHLRAGAAKS